MSGAEGLRLARFAVIGALTFLIYAAATELVLRLSGAGPTVAALPAFLFAVAFNYMAHRLWTFASVRAHAVALPRYAAMIGGGLVLSSAVVWLGAEAFRLPLLGVQMAAAVLVAVYNYLVLSRLVFD